MEANASAKMDILMSIVNKFVMLVIILAKLARPVRTQSV